MGYTPLKGEVFFCGKCSRQYSASGPVKCPVCGKTMISWYTDKEGSSEAMKKWKQVNGWYHYRYCLPGCCYNNISLSFYLPINWIWIMVYQTCAKCKGNNSKSFEICSCVQGRIADKGCVVCKGSGKAPCYSCRGSGKVYSGIKPWLVELWII